MTEHNPHVPKLSEKFHEKIRAYVRQLQRYAGKPWYPALIGFLAALDNIIIVVPNDGILISSSMLTPRKWFSLALSVTIGSTVGAVILAAIVMYMGLPWVIEMYPGIDATKTWALSVDFFNQYGLMLVFIVALTPLFQQPAVILAAMANTPLGIIALIIFLGRFIKFFIMAYLGSHAPRLLKKMWGISSELRDAGIEISDDKKS